MNKKLFTFVLLFVGLLVASFSLAASDLDYCLFPGKCGNEVPATPSSPNQSQPPPAVIQQVMPNGNACFCFNITCKEDDITQRKEKRYDVAFVVDVSGTMAHGFLKTINKTPTIQIPINNVMDSVKKILDDKYLNESVDKVALVAFGNLGTIKINWTSDFKTKIVKGKSVTGGFINQLNAIGAQVLRNPDCNTNLAGGFMAVNDLFKNARKDSSKIVIVLSDGVMNAYTLNGLKKECAGDGYPVVADDCVKQAVAQSEIIKKQGIKVYAIGYSIEATGKIYTGKISIGNKAYNYQDVCWRTTVPAHPGAGEFAENNVLKKITNPDEPGITYYTRDEDFSNLTSEFQKIFEREVRGSVIPGACKKVQVVAKLKPGLTFDTTPSVVASNAPKGKYAPSVNANTISFDTTKFTVTRNGQKTPLTQLNKDNTLTFRLYIAKGYKGKGGLNVSDILNLNESKISYTASNNKVVNKTFGNVSSIVWTNSPDCVCKEAKKTGNPKLNLTIEADKDKCNALANVVVKCLEDNVSNPANIPCQNVEAVVEFPEYVINATPDTRLKWEEIGPRKFKIFVGQLSVNREESINFKLINDRFAQKDGLTAQVSATWNWQDALGNVVVGRPPEPKETPIPKDDCFSNLATFKKTKFVCDQNTKTTSGQTSVNISCTSDTVSQEPCLGTQFTISNIPSYLKLAKASLVDRFGLNTWPVSVISPIRAENQDGTFNLDFHLGVLSANSARLIVLDWDTETKYADEENPNPVRRYKDKLIAGFSNYLDGKSKLEITQEGEVEIPFCTLPAKPKIEVEVNFTPNTFCDRTDGMTKTFSKMSVSCVADNCEDVVVRYQLPDFIKRDKSNVKAYYQGAGPDSKPSFITNFYNEEKPNNFVLRLGNLARNEKFLVDTVFQVDTVKQYAQPEQNIIVDYYLGGYPNGKIAKLHDVYQVSTNQKIDEACCYTVIFNKSMTQFKERKRCIAIVLDESESMTYPTDNQSLCTGQTCHGKDCVSGIVDNSLMRQDAGSRIGNPGNDFKSDEIFVVPFSNEARRDFSGCDPGRDNPSSGVCRQKAESAAGTSGGGLGNMEDALHTAADKVITACSGAYDARYIYVYSDGIPTASGINSSQPCDFSKATSEDDFFNSSCFTGAIKEAKRASESRVAIIAVLPGWLPKYNSQRVKEKMPENKNIDVLKIGKRLMQTISYATLQGRDPTGSSCTLGTLDWKIADDICKGVRYRGKFVEGIDYVQNSARSGSYLLKTDEVYNDQQGYKVFDAKQYTMSAGDYQTSLEFVVGRVLGFKGSLNKEDFDNFRISCINGSLVDETRGRLDSMSVNKNASCRIRR